MRFSSSRQTRTHARTHTGVKGDDEVFLPAIPLAQNDDDFAVPPLDDAGGGGGKVVCHYSFREAQVPKVM